MGLMSALAGLGLVLREGRGVARVLKGDKAAEAEAEHVEHLAALSQLAAEFQSPRISWFDTTIDALNRLPRPSLALGTMGLFVYAMVDPVGFAARMQGLILVPDQLWWLLGAIVSFYFGARELHYFRERRGAPSLDRLREVQEAQAAIDAMEPARDRLAEGGLFLPWFGRRRRVASPAGDPAARDHNAALEEWLAQSG